MCVGCKDHETSKSCKVKLGNEQKKYNNCSECKEIHGIKTCTILYPFSYKLGELIAGMSREAGLNMLEDKGAKKFAEFITMENECLCLKCKNIVKSKNY